MKNLKKVMYAIVDIFGEVEPRTLNYQRKGAIKTFLDGSNMTWKQCSDIGWSVEKVNVSISKA
ncbi:hypothetical protein [Flavobacterium anhuiense]|uniref:hypothetical protein n=1 Tax=Flavobacterium anhuiense TaxID=459526 RepID=UPI00202652B1|nr:hypothetical protein [Flavobacterium anhuiense]URM37166.1 hypothetical protein LLY39_00815 [Flavobacterium anhuiense]